MKVSDFFAYMKPGCRGHLVGIGGVSMSALGEVLHSMGLVITGSDMNESETVQKLRESGIPVVIGHLPESVEDAAFAASLEASLAFFIALLRFLASFSFFLASFCCFSIAF